MAPTSLAKFVWISNFMLNTFLILASLTFKLLIVLPEIYKNRIILFIGGVIESFICFNIIGNLLACSIVDSSINLLKDRPPKDSTQHGTWHYCRKCEALVPPRSWHCDICKICILKRDHHCSFIGRCVGHQNFRYFFIFIFYVAMETTLATIHNSIYFWWLHGDVYGNWKTALNLMFPVLLLWPLSWQSSFVLAYEMNFILAIVSCCTLALYMKCFMSGRTLYEFRSKITTYDLGSKNLNLQTILGKRMNWVWVAPFIKSELLHDGINWESNHEENP